MTVETVDNGVAPYGDTFSNPNVTASSKKSRESERRRRRRKQKKNKKGSEVDVEEGNVSAAASDSKENTDPQKQVSFVFFFALYITRSWRFLGFFMYHSR